MSIIQSIILGIVEGITEFLPVSSTFHLILASDLLGIPQTDSQKVFEVVVQGGAILAAVIVYARTLFQQPQLFKKVAVSFIPTALIGFVLYKLIKGFFFENVVLQLSVFVLVGIVFILVEKFRRPTSGENSISNLSYAQAFFVGSMQALAVIPGVSRAGAVIVALLLLNTKRDEAAKYSFLLAIPTILSASLFDLYKSQDLMANMSDWVPLVIGSLVAFITAWVTIKWLIRYLQTHSLTSFGWYRIILVTIIAALTFF